MNMICHQATRIYLAAKFFLERNHVLTLMLKVIARFRGNLAIMPPLLDIMGLCRVKPLLLNAAIVFIGTRGLMGR